MQFKMRVEEVQFKMRVEEVQEEGGWDCAIGGSISHTTKVQQ